MGKQLIEQQSFVYYIYQDDDGIYELSVPVPTPSPGFNVKHKMTSDETSEYLKNGVDALKERIKDMEQNIYDYELKSWR